MSNKTEILKFEQLSVEVLFAIKGGIICKDLYACETYACESHVCDSGASSPCSTCEIFDSCFSNLNRCWAEILKAYGDENWDYPDPRCAKAPKMKNNLQFV